MADNGRHPRGGKKPPSGPPPPAKGRGRPGNPKLPVRAPLGGKAPPKAATAKSDAPAPDVRSVVRTLAVGNNSQLSSAPGNASTQTSRLAPGFTQSTKPTVKPTLSLFLGSKVQTQAAAPQAPTKPMSFRDAVGNTNNVKTTFKPASEPVPLNTGLFRLTSASIHEENARIVGRPGFAGAAVGGHIKNLSRKRNPVSNTSLAHTAFLADLMSKPVLSTKEEQDENTAKFAKGCAELRTWYHTDATTPPHGCEPEGPVCKALLAPNPVLVVMHGHDNSSQDVWACTNGVNCKLGVDSMMPYLQFNGVESHNEEKLYLTRDKLTSMTLGEAKAHVLSCSLDDEDCTNEGIRKAALEHLGTSLPDVVAAQISDFGRESDPEKKSKQGLLMFRVRVKARQEFPVKSTVIGSWLTENIPASLIVCTERHRIKDSVLMEMWEEQMQRVPFKFYKDQMNKKKGFLPFIEDPGQHQLQFPPWMMSPEVPGNVNSFDIQWKWHSVESYRYAMSIAVVREQQYAYNQTQQHYGPARPIKGKVISSTAAGHVVMEFSTLRDESVNVQPLTPNTRVILTQWSDPAEGEPKGADVPKPNDEAAMQGVTLTSPPQQTSADDQNMTSIGV